jgi:type II secretory ATPase GspE/PulE/Tfp pilus assembly ATPase PilB-like protein
MQEADGPTLDQVVQAIVLDGVSRGSDQTRIAVRGDELQASYFDSGEFRVGVAVPADWSGRVGRRLKLMAGILLTDPRVPQQGRFRRTAVVRGRLCELEVAVSTEPDVACGTIVLAIQNVRWGEEAADPTTRLLDEAEPFQKRPLSGRPTRS